MQVEMGCLSKEEAGLQCRELVEEHKQAQNRIDTEAAVRMASRNDLMKQIAIKAESLAAAKVESGIKSESSSKVPASKVNVARKQSPVLFPTPSDLPSTVNSAPSLITNVSSETSIVGNPIPLNI